MLYIYMGSKYTLNMNIQSIGSIIKHERNACGLSQKALAVASHLSRVTIVNLEKGKVGDIGAVKLSEIADIVGKPLFSTGGKMDFLQMILGHINTSYKTTMTVDDLEIVMLNGKLLSGFEGQIFHLLEEAPTSLVSGAIKQLAIRKNVSAKLLWKNLALIAKQINSPKEFWAAIG